MAQLEAVQLCSRCRRQRLLQPLRRHTSSWAWWYMSRPAARVRPQLQLLLGAGATLALPPPPPQAVWVLMVQRRARSRTRWPHRTTSRVCALARRGSSQRSLGRRRGRSVDQVLDQRLLQFPPRRLSRPRTPRFDFNLREMPPLPPVAPLPLRPPRPSAPPSGSSSTTSASARPPHWTCWTFLPPGKRPRSCCTSARARTPCPRAPLRAAPVPPRRSQRYVARRGFGFQTRIGPRGPSPRT